MGESWPFPPGMVCPPGVCDQWYFASDSGIFEDIFLRDQKNDSLTETRLNCFSVTASNIFFNLS